jgi:type 1 glutamine amidotransferase
MIHHGRTLAFALFASLVGACRHGTATDPGESCDLDVSRVVATPATPPPVAFRVLAFTKTAGYHHASIPAGVRALKALGLATGFTLDTTSDAATFTASGLAPYRVVVFLNTTGDVLAPAQQTALEQFLSAGNGWVGVHSASDTEYEWPWYQSMLGAHFVSHPAIQQAQVSIVDANHVSTTGIVSPWQRIDEWYNFSNALPAEIHVLARVDEASYTGGGMGGDHPIAWTHVYGGGRAWYTAMGHTSCSYVERAYLTHLRGGVLWAAGADSLAARPF